MHECRNTLCFPNLPVNSSSSCQKFPNLDVIYQEIVPILVWLERLEIGRFLAHMDQLFLRGSALPPQAWHCLLACLKKCVTIKISDSLG